MYFPITKILFHNQAKLTFGPIPPCKALSLVPTSAAVGLTVIVLKAVERRGLLQKSESKGAAPSHFPPLRCCCWRGRAGGGEEELQTSGPSRAQPELWFAGERRVPGNGARPEASRMWLRGGLGLAAGPAALGASLKGAEQQNPSQTKIQDQRNRANSQAPSPTGAPGRSSLPQSQPTPAAQGLSGQPQSPRGENLLPNA